jgi:hypothetical protein
MQGEPMSTLMPLQKSEINSRLKIVKRERSMNGPNWSGRLRRSPARRVALHNLPGWLGRKSLYTTSHSPRAGTQTWPPVRSENPTRGIQKNLHARMGHSGRGGVAENHISATVAMIGTPCFFLNGRHQRGLLNHRL